MEDRFNTLDWYQRASIRTIGDAGLAVLGLGIAGEAGEVADLIKKHLGHGHKLDREKLTAELGDVLWYVATLAYVLNVPLSRVADLNIIKLAKRYPAGFDPERSKNRDEELLKGGAK